MSTLSFEDQPKTPTRSYQLQADSPVASTPRSTQSPAVPASNPPPARRPYQGYNAQAQHWQQQPPSATLAYAPQYPAVRQPSVIAQPVRQQSAQDSDTFCCCDVKTAVQVFATIMLILYCMGTGWNVYVHLTHSTYDFYGEYTYPACAVITLILILDVVNACCVQSSCWYCFSSVIWSISAGINITLLLAVTVYIFIYFSGAMLIVLIVWLFVAPGIALLITYIIALCKASDLAAKQQLEGNVMPSQPQYAPQSPMHPQYAHNQQAYRV